jgi:hypothetical protein
VSTYTSKSHAGQKYSPSVLTFLVNCLVKWVIRDLPTPPRSHDMAKPSRCIGEKIPDYLKYWLKILSFQNPVYAQIYRQVAPSWPRQVVPSQVDFSGLIQSIREKKGPFGTNTECPSLPMRLKRCIQGSFVMSREVWRAGWFCFYYLICFIKCNIPNKYIKIIL